MADSYIKGTINVLKSTDSYGNSQYIKLYPQTIPEQVVGLTDLVDTQIDAKIADIPNASASERGLVLTGANITNNSGVISLTKNNITAALGFTPVAEGTTVNNAAEALTANTLTTARTIDGVSFNGSQAISHYATCSTAGDTTVKTVVCSGFNLVAGATITITFTATNTATDPSLNVNNTGAKPIHYRGETIAPSYLAVNHTYSFVYDGSTYNLIGDIDTDVDTQAVTGVKGSAETEFHIGQVNITAANIGLGNVNNTADNVKSVLSASKLTTPRTISVVGGATSTSTEFDGSKNISIEVTALDVSKTSAGVLPVAYGGTGQTSLSSVAVGKANIATALETLRGLTISDANGENSGTMSTFDGTQDITIKLPTTIRANIVGSATSAGIADSLSTARTINGVSFNGSKNITNYTVCTTAANTISKAVALEGFTLVTGAQVIVTFTLGNSVDSPSLNVNSTGAKPIQYAGKDVKASAIVANHTYTMVYDGNAYQIVGVTGTSASTAGTVSSTAEAVIPTDGWEYEESEATQFKYKYIIPVDGISEYSIANVIIIRNDAYIADLSGICPSNETVNDGIVIRASSIPQHPINVQYYILG